MVEGQKARARASFARVRLVQSQGPRTARAEQHLGIVAEKREKLNPNDFWCTEQNITLLKPSIREAWINGEASQDKTPDQ